MNYNVPEEQFSRFTSPEDREREFKDMVNECHKNGIRVLMDVVYNHTAGKDVFQNITGKCYHQTELSGTANSNDDGNPIVSRMIRDSLEYWVKNYNVDGFRFDLIGVHQYKNVDRWATYLQTTFPDRTLQIHGEPWSGGVDDPQQAQKVRYGTTPAIAGGHVGVFNGTYRDAVKGGTRDQVLGYMGGSSSNPASVALGMRGSPLATKSTNPLSDPWAPAFAYDPEQTINYVPAHDDLNLWDKITYSGVTGGTTGRAGQMHRFGTGVVLTSQGIPRRWWQARGRHDYPRARRLLITADGGGSNGYRTCGWKTQLADLVAETGLEITVCHLPPGTSKWNKIEHRLFSHITMNWRGRPLTSHEVMLQTIAATTSRTGLTVQAELDSGEYPTGIRVSDDEIAALPITLHRFHGDWNYTLHPQRPTDAATTAGTPDETQTERPARLTRVSLQNPELTGMTRQQLNELIDVLTPAMEVQRKHVLRTRRGHERLVAPGTGAKAKLTSADRVLVTVLHLRKLATMDLLGQLFDTTAMTISRAAKDVRPLLETHRIHISASTARFRTPADIARFLDPDKNKIKPTC